VREQIDGLLGNEVPMRGDTPRCFPFRDIHRDPAVTDQALVRARENW
jgi:hypothetical protein